MGLWGAVCMLVYACLFVFTNRQRSVGLPPQPCTRRILHHTRPHRPKLPPTYYLTLTAYHVLPTACYFTTCSFLRQLTAYCLLPTLYSITGRRHLTACYVLLLYYVYYVLLLYYVYYVLLLYYVYYVLLLYYMYYVLLLY